MLTTEFLTGWVVLSLLVAAVAKHFGHSFLAALIAGLLFSPLIAVILVLVSKPSSAKRVPCPECAEQVLVAAIKCKHCGADLAAYKSQGLGKT